MIATVIFLHNEDVSFRQVLLENLKLNGGKIESFSDNLSLSNISSFLALGSV